MSVKSKNTDPTFYNSLDESEKNAWWLFEAGIKDRKSYFHTPVVVSKTKTGAVNPRTMVLRAVNRSALELQFHTDKRSNKINEFAVNKSGAVLVYDMATKVQVRIDAEFRIIDDPAILENRWSKMKSMSKECYAVSKPPGSELKDPINVDYDVDGVSNFTILSAKVLQLEWLYLCYKGNRRALFDYRTEQPIKSWLVP